MNDVEANQHTKELCPKAGGALHGKALVLIKDAVRDKRACACSKALVPVIVAAAHDCQGLQGHGIQYVREGWRLVSKVGS